MYPLVTMTSTTAAPFINNLPLDSGSVDISQKNEVVSLDADAKGTNRAAGQE